LNPSHIFFGGIKMAKEKLQKVLIEKLLATYLRGKTFKKNMIYKVIINKSDYFMIITDSGFEIYFASKKIQDNIEVLDTVELKHSLTWNDFESVKVDKFALSTLYEFNTGLKLQVNASNDLTEELKTNGVSVNLLERKWYNKILGFRSKKKWKMVIASIGYLFILFVTIGIFSDGDKPSEQEASSVVTASNNSSTQESESTKEDNQKAEDEAKQKAEKEANKKAEEEAAAKKKAEEEAKKTPQQQMFEKISGLFASKQAFDTGSYIKGDIPAGEYAFISFDGSGKYYCENDSANNILDNENFDSFGYVYVNSVGNLETQGVLISTNAFQTLGVTGAKQIYEIVNNVQNFKESGYYKVGLDIPAGQYTIQSTGQGYVANMSGPVGKSDINDNENFNGKYSVTVTNGQYLQISHGLLLQ
jgi:hypothetical protein